MWTHFKVQGRCCVKFVSCFATYQRHYVFLFCFVLFSFLFFKKRVLRGLNGVGSILCVMRDYYLSLSKLYELLFEIPEWPHEIIRKYYLNIASFLPGLCIHSDFSHFLWQFNCTTYISSIWINSNSTDSMVKW